MKPSPFRTPLPRHPVSELLARIDQLFNPLSVETIPIDQAWGRALAREVVAVHDVPGFDRAAMDGYAIRAGDSGPRQVIGEAYPAQPFVGTVQPGQAVRVTTGAPMPAGADTVVPYEQVSDSWQMPTLPEGKNVGRRGEDVRAGQTVFTAGRLLRPQDGALLAAAGVSSVFVHRIPRLSVLVTGNELVPAGTIPQGYRIVDSNSTLLGALIRRDGGEPDLGPIIPDQPEALREALLMADGDLLLVCGGSSVGMEDYVPALLAEEGELLLQGLALKPGGPVGLGILRGRYVFLMPGNPVSCLCAYDLFAGRALRRMVGRGNELPYVQVQVPLAETLLSSVGRTDYVRVIVREGQASPISQRGASVLSSVCEADGFVLVDEGIAQIEAGQKISVYLYDTFRGSLAGARWGAS
ncbi:MAG: gephyrin-like molybdotransferase Glp [Gemmataceae bacterium]